MDVFQAWALGHWVTFAAASLLAINFILAWAASRKFLVFGALGLICFWLMTIAIVMLLRDKNAAFWRFAIDTGAVFLFYRLAERDAKTGERHDWAALICFCYVWLVIIDARTLIFGNNNSNFFIAMSNVVFVLKALFNIAPSVATLLGNDRFLIAKKN